MTKSMEALYQNALLSDAVYLDWVRLSSDENNDAYKQRMARLLVRERNFTEKQAEVFVDRYQVISNKPNTPTGFSATLFLDTKGTEDESDDEEVLAIRGTESSLDFFEDAYLALGPRGKASRQFEDLKDFIQGLKDQGHLQKSFTVSGHSLGGHLTTMLTLAAEDSDNNDPRLAGINIDHAYTYNGAGLGTFIFGAGLVQLFENLLPGVDFNQPHDKITNLFSTAGIELVSNVGITFGETIPVFTENQGELFDAIGNHYIRFLNDSLSVYRILDQLEPIETQSDFERVHNILAGASNQPTESLNNVLESVGRLFGIDADYHDLEQTDAFFDGLEDVLNDRFPDQTFNLLKLVDENSKATQVGSIFSLALSNESARGIAYRYALEELNPFVLQVNNPSGGADEAATEALYAPHNQGDRLALDNFSTEYLEDRARLLFEKLRLGIKDIGSDSQDFIRTGGDGQLIEFAGKLIRITDVASNLKVELDPTFDFVSRTQGNDIPDAILRQNQTPHQIIFHDESGTTLTGGEAADHIYGNGGDDTIDGNDGGDHIEGNLGNDTLIGGRGADTLIGGEGNDILYGGIKAGAENHDDNQPDTLDGGAGLDTYHVGQGDVTKDSDGRGIIHYRDADNSGVTVSNRTYTFKEDNIYESDDDDRIRVQFNPLRNILEVQGAITFTIENFQDGDFNITLDGEPEEIVYDTLLTGTAADDDSSDFDSTALNDEIRTLGGNDSANGGAGRDLLVGGEGDDRLSGNSDDDILQGDAGRDVLFGGIGNDHLLGGGETDVLLGGDGNDIVNGGAGIDVLLGGDGRDTLLGGEGTDLLIANGEASVGSSWDVTLDSGRFELTDITLSAGQIQSGLFIPVGITGGNLFGGDGNDLLIGSEASDRLEGEAGNDTIEAGDGNDLIRGGDGVDLIVGDSGHDMIYGGEGNDRIYGDKVLDSSSQFTGGEDGEDYIDGGAGDDFIVGGGAADTLIGGAGNDELHGEEGNDSLDGGSGDDLLFGGVDNDTLTGGAGNDQLQGGEDDDYLNGGDGNDLMAGGEGNDTLLGGYGDDQLQGTAGKNLLNGGEGDDLLFGGQDVDTLMGDAGDDQLQGGAGDDILDGGSGNDILFGQAGDDTVYGGTGDDQMQGGDGEDQLDGGEGDDLIFGTAGNDVLAGGSGDDALLGGVGDDTLNGGAGNDELQGEAGDDHLNGGAGNDLLFGGAGNDSLSGGSGADQLAGGAGNDTLNGGGGDDRLFAESGADIVNGGSGADILNGGADDDQLDGGDGSDILVGGVGNDAIEGGLGHDRYIYEPGYGHEVITDSGAYDTIILEGGITRDDVTITEGGPDLLISLDTENSLRLIDAADTPSIEAIVFSDGSTHTHENFLTGADSGQYYNNPSTSGVNARIGTDGNDIFNIDGTFNHFEGGHGDDAYYFNRNSTTLEILDAGGNDALVLGDDITVEDFDPQLEDGNLEIVFGDSQIRIDDWSANHIERFFFSDGTILQASDFGLAINNPPERIGTIEDQVVDEDTLFDFQIPQDVFMDPDNDALIYGASLANGDALPEWLSFDPDMRSFNGTPDNENVGSLAIKVTATDPAGESASDTFGLTVNNVNDAPVVNQPIDDAVAYVKNDFSFTLPAETFVDVDAGDSLHITARLDNGEALPDWLEFDAETRTFSGRPGIADYGAVGVVVTATDEAGASAETGFALSVDSEASQVTGDDSSNALLGTRQDNLVDGQGGNDVLVGLFGDDILLGGDGRDMLMNLSGESFMHGGKGDDRLLGGFDQDTLTGGRGDDVLRGGFGDDTYIFRQGDGNDLISESGGHDKLIFKDVEESQLQFSRSGLDLNINIQDTDDRVTIKRWYMSNRNKVESIETAGGNQVDLEHQSQLLAQSMGGFNILGMGNMTFNALLEDSPLAVLAAAINTG